jgi:signal peptidase II
LRRTGLWEDGIDGIDGSEASDLPYPSDPNPKSATGKMFWWVAWLVLVIDQASKGLVLWKMEPNDSLPVIRGIFHITLTHNTGIAFGMAQGRGWLTIPLAMLVMSAILWYRHRMTGPKRWNEILTGLLFGGALANLLDRLRLGYVVDLFDFQVWPVFNVADMAITSAIFIFIISQFFHDPDAQPSPIPVQTGLEEPDHDADAV